MVSASYRGALGKGLLFGLLAGALWVASRRYDGQLPSLIDWQRVRDAAVKIGELDDGHERAPGWNGAELSRRYAGMVRQSQDLIGAYVGAELPERWNSIHVFDRRDWIEANLASFQALMEPLERVNQETLNEGTVGAFLLANLNRFVLSGELGALVGYLSRRVLGQYDLALLGGEPATSGRLYFVEPNIARLQRRGGLDPQELRLWIALHETTHAFEFEGHPWLRHHMNGLLGRYFDSLSHDIAGLKRRGVGVMELAQRIGSNLLRSSHALELVMTGEQQRIFRQLQALMCLLEGYSNHVMDRVGHSLLRSYPTLKALFEDRLRQKTLGERLFAKLTGLDIKLEQYVLGERFVGEVVRERGVEYANRVWTSPWHLPTLEEIKQPLRWIERVAGPRRV